MTTVIASSINAPLTSRQSSHSGSGKRTSSSQSSIDDRPGIPSRPSLAGTRTGSLASIKSRGNGSQSRRHSLAGCTRSTHSSAPPDRRLSMTTRRASATSAAAPQFDPSPVTLHADGTSIVKLRRITPEEECHYAQSTTGKLTFGYKPGYLAKATGLAGLPTRFMVDFLVKTEAGLQERSIRLSECGFSYNVDVEDSRRLIAYMSRVISALDNPRTTVLPLPGVYLLNIEFPNGLGKERAVHAQFTFNWTWPDPQATIRVGYLTELHKNTLPRGRGYSYKALIEAPRPSLRSFGQYVPWDDLAEPAGLPATARGIQSRANILAYLGTTNQIGEYYCFSDWRIEDITFNLAGHYLGARLVDVRSKSLRPRLIPSMPRTPPSAEQQAQQRKSSTVSLSRKMPREETIRQGTGQSISGAPQRQHASAGGFKRQVIPGRP